MWTSQTYLRSRAIVFLFCLYVYGTNNEPNMVPGRSVIVHLFEWRFDDIAEECERFLGPRGYGGVQTSPVNEHGMGFVEKKKRPWYERYQPVSYKIETRSGNETQFRDMVRRCNKAGLYPAVPFAPDDFHAKRQCSSKSGGIDNYGDVNQVRNCELLGLRDLNHARKHVRAKISEFLNQLISLGVVGFRADAAKHMWPADLKVIYAKLYNLSTEFFTAGAMPFIYQEVIDMGQGKPITRWDYNQMGRVTEFNYSAKLGAVRRKRLGQLLKNLQSFGEAWHFLPSSDALTLSATVPQAREAAW
nr:LOW QUALITY PROTEIN: alpha-amylase 2B-like [Rhipicephalus microplus]